MEIRNDLFKNSQIIDCPNDRCEEEIKETDTKCPACFCDVKGVIRAMGKSKELLLWD